MTKALPLPIRPPEIVAREFLYPRRDIWILLAVCAGVRLALMPINAGEYTDGVLQACEMENPIGIWPPLYPLLVYPLKFLFGYLWAGRLVSVIAGTLALLPLYKMTQRAFGTRAALYAGIFYITAPVATRWGVRLMTDATFSLFFWWTCERLCFAADERDGKAANRALGWACLGAVLAALTRYQGLLLVLPVIACAMVMRRRFSALPVKPLLWLLGYAALPAWLHLSGDTFIHFDQFAARSGSGSPRPMWWVLAMNGEAFVAYFPYFLTYPVFICSLAGMFWTRQRRSPFFGWLMLYVAVVLLIAQSAFSSLQERYLLPLMGFFWVLGGAGLWAIQERWLRHKDSLLRRAYPYLMIGIFAWSAAFGLLVMFAQRESWGDLAKASRFAAETASPGQRIFTNDCYPTSKRTFGAPKVIFFSGKPAEYLDDSYIPAATMRSTFGGSPAVRPPSQRMTPGDLLVLADAYDGLAQHGYLLRYYDLKEIHEPFEATILPLLPDIMSQPGTSQNPTAWFFRYEWQRFATRVYRVEALR